MSDDETTSVHAELARQTAELRIIRKYVGWLLAVVVIPMLLTALIVLTNR